LFSHKVITKHGLIHSLQQICRVSVDEFPSTCLPDAIIAIPKVTFLIISKTMNNNYSHENRSEA